MTLRTATSQKRTGLAFGEHKSIGGKVGEGGPLPEQRPAPMLGDTGLLAFAAEGESALRLMWACMRAS